MSDPKTSYSARPDGKMTLHDFFKLVPHAWREQLEDDINAILEAGYGDLTLHFVRGKLDSWQAPPTRKVSNRQNEK